MADRLEDIRERLAAASTKVEHFGELWQNGPADAALTAHARADISYLLGEVTRLQQKLDASIAAALDTQRRLDTELLEARELNDRYEALGTELADDVDNWRARAKADHAKLEQVVTYTKALRMAAKAAASADIAYGLERAANGLDSLLSSHVLAKDGPAD